MILFYGGLYNLTKQKHLINQKQMIAQKFRSKLKQNIIQNYNICQMFTSQDDNTIPNFTQLKYEQKMYLLFNGQIPIAQISYFKNKKYKDKQLPSMQKTFIIEDAIKINEEIITKAWKYNKLKKRDSKRSITLDQAKIMNNHIGNKYQIIDMNEFGQINKYKKSRCSSHGENHCQQTKEIEETKISINMLEKQSTESQKNQKSMIQQQSCIKMKRKIALLEQQLKTIQGKLNMAHTESQAVQQQKQYNKILKQLNAAKNKKRQKQQSSLLQRIQQQQSPIESQKLQMLLQKMNQIRVNNSRQLNKPTKSNQKISKIQQLSRINSIFNYYSKKQIKNNHQYFSELQQSQHKLYLETFLLFVKQFEIHRIISMELIVQIFKLKSKGKRFIDCGQFSEILADIHNQQCIKQQQSISNQSTSQYIQQYIVNNRKMNKILMNCSESKDTIRDEIKYQPISHSGKYLDDIKKILQQRKQTIDFLGLRQKKHGGHHKEKSKSTVVCPNNNSNSNSNSNRNSNSNSNRNNNNNNNNNNINYLIFMNSSKVVTNSGQNMETLSSHKFMPSSHVSIGYDNNNMNSYALRFKLKNTKNRFKTQGIIRAIHNTINTRQEKDSQQNEIKFSRNDSLNVGNENQNMRQINSQKKQSTNSKNKCNKDQYPQNENEEEKQQKLTIVNILNKKVFQKIRYDDPQFQGFQNLIEGISQDQYLNKQILPPIYPKKIKQIIHY